MAEAVEHAKRRAEEHQQQRFIGESRHYREPFLVLEDGRVERSLNRSLA